MNAPLAEFRTYAEMRGAFSSVRELRDIPYEVLDEIAGLQSGYSSKLLGPRQIKRMGLQSLDLLLGALGVKAVLVDDPEALARVQSRFKSRDKPHLASVMHGASSIVSFDARFFKKIGAKGKQSRWGNMTEKQKSRHGKKMAKSRWRRQKQRARQRRQTHKARKG